MRGMRAVSFLSPGKSKFGAGVTGTGVTAAGTGIETAGDFSGEGGEGGGDWKNWGESRSWSARFEAGGGPVGVWRGALSDG